MAENERRPARRDAPGSPSWWSVAARPGSRSPARSRELARSGLERQLPPDRPAPTREVLLVDGGKEILATFGDRLSGEGRRGAATARRDHPQQVRRHGRRRRSGSTCATPTARPSGSCARTKIWAAGVQASPLAGLLAEASGATCDRAGRIAVLDDCTLPGHPEVFAIGDMMALDDLPGVAEVAMQSGIHAANTIKRRLRRQGGGDVHLPRPRQHGHHLPLPRRGQLQGSSGCPGSSGG